MEPPKKKTLLCFDFDGVIVDSKRETGATAFRAGKSLWPELFDGVYDEPVEKAFSQLRPAMLYGHDAPVLMRLFLQGNSAAESRRRLIEEREETFRSCGVHSEDHIRTVFNDTRREWMVASREGDPDENWFKIQPFYRRPAEIFKSALAVDSDAFHVYVITTKKAEFALALLEEQGASFEAENLFGLGSGEKPEVLKRLIKDHGEDCRVFFVEDRLETLKLVTEDPYLKPRVSCLLVDWGYNTAEERGDAASFGVQLVDEEGLGSVVEALLKEV